LAAEKNVIDTVLYDSPNSNGLPDDSSHPGQLFAPDVPSGYTLARRGLDTDDCGKDFFAEDVPTPGEENVVFPVAVIQVETPVSAWGTTILDGSNSSDPDGEIENWFWTIARNGEVITTLDGETVEYVFGNTGEFTVTLQVTDNDNLESSDTETITALEIEPEHTDIIDAKSLETGKTVTVIGTVTASIPNLYEKEGYVQDKTGGIRIKIQDGQEMEYGNTYLIGGEIDTTYGEKRIQVSTVSLINDHYEIFPANIHLAQIDESYTGSLITTEGKISRIQDNYYYIIDEKSDKEYRVYFSSFTEALKPEDAKGKYMQVTGVVSRYGTNSDGTPRLRIMPRFETDISISDKPQFLASTGTSIFRFLRQMYICGFLLPVVF
jgi:uncharacterized protein YdeI (BOF family)